MTNIAIKIAPNVIQWWTRVTKILKRLDGCEPAAVTVEAKSDMKGNSE
jgi:hypothetical protein